MRHIKLSNVHESCEGLGEVYAQQCYTHVKYPPNNWNDSEVEHYASRLLDELHHDYATVEGTNEKLVCRGYVIYRTIPPRGYSIPIVV